MKKVLAISVMSTWLLLFPFWPGQCSAGPPQEKTRSSLEQQDPTLKEKPRDTGKPRGEVDREVKKPKAELPERVGKELKKAGKFMKESGQKVKKKMKERWKELKTSAEKQNTSENQ